MSESNSLALWDALKPMIDREINQQTANRAVMKRMVVSTVYDEGTKKIGVREAYGDEVLLPVMGFVDTEALEEGVSVWVLCPYGTLSNAMVMCDGNGLGISTGGSSEQSVFIATYGVTTLAELQAAKAAGKHIVVISGGDVYQLAYASTNSFYFSQLYATTNYYCNCGNGGWSSGTVGMQPTLNNYTATFTAAGWSNSAPYTQTVSVSGLSASKRAWIDIDMSNATTSTYEDLKNAWALVDDCDTGNNTITLTCFGDKPSVDLPVIITS